MGQRCQSQTPEIVVAMVVQKLKRFVMFWFGVVVAQHKI